MSLCLEAWQRPALQVGGRMECPQPGMCCEGNRLLFCPFPHCSTRHAKNTALNVPCWMNTGAGLLIWRKRRHAHLTCTCPHDFAAQASPCMMHVDSRRPQACASTAQALIHSFFYKTSIALLDVGLCECLLNGCRTLPNTQPAHLLAQLPWQLYSLLAK